MTSSCRHGDAISDVIKNELILSLFRSPSVHRWSVRVHSWAELYEAKEPTSYGLSTNAVTWYYRGLCTALSLIHWIYIGLYCILCLISSSNNCVGGLKKRQVYIYIYISINLQSLLGTNVTVSLNK